MQTAGYNGAGTVFLWEKVRVRVRVRVRSSKNEVRCASACGTIIKVRVCVRHTVKILATQHLLICFLKREKSHRKSYLPKKKEKIFCLKD